MVVQPFHSVVLQPQAVTTPPYHRGAMRTPHPPRPIATCAIRPPGHGRRRVSDSEVFTHRVGPAGGIVVVAAALARKLAAVATRPGTQIVFVDIVGREGHYTQCLIDPDHGAWAEAVSNAYIVDPGLRLDHHQEQTLADLGFEPPGEVSENHHRVVNHPVGWSYVAELLALPFGAVFPVGPLDELRVTVRPQEPPTLRACP